MGGCSGEPAARPNLKEELRPREYLAPQTGRQGGVGGKRGTSRMPAQYGNALHRRKRELFAGFRQYLERRRITATADVFG
jgi:hypothetical protein